ncbi:GGDEF domain-containing protein [Pelosinus sp. sgz500959]|uniref:GGDEF domain-containing protein n=1 Tax=Pelosinus sp. sgz500959 TaxID=3242472 RepID=UPI00366A97A0
MIRILIADDKSVNRRMLRNMIEEMDMRSIEAHDGEEAWEILQRDDAPQIVLLDWVMPKLSGLEVCRRIALERLQSAKYSYVILITSKDKDEEITEGFLAGADDYITRPFNGNELRMRLRVGIRIVQMQRDLLKLLHWDPLTNALNRRAVLERLDEEIKRSTRSKSPLSIAMLDIDHFKEINDTHGHLVGDIVLTEAVARILNSLRSYDLVGRYGGDEFLLIFPDTTAADANTMCNRIRNSFLQDPIMSGDLTLFLTVSVGVTSLNGSTSLADTLIHHADDALYTAKRHGRNQVFLADLQVQV